MKEKGLKILLNKFFKITNKKITAVFFNNDYFKILIYFEGAKLSLSLFVEDFFNSFNTSELIILD